MKHKLLKSLLLLSALVVGSSSVWADVITYTFTGKDWKASAGGSEANWTKGAEGSGFTDGQGIQVTTTNTGANGTSPASFSQISKIVVTYNTNKSAGEGSIGVTIGTNSETSNAVAYSGSGDGRSANYTTTFNYSTTQTGKVKITVNTTTNSIWLKSVEITYDASAVLPTHTLTYSATNGSIGGVVYGSSTVVASGAAVAEGGEVTLTATPASGYIFSSWEVSGTGSTLTSTTSNPTTFTMGTADATVTANFVVDNRVIKTLDGTDMSGMSNAGSGYGTLKSITKSGLVWETTGYQTSDYKNMIQLKSGASYYIKLPEFPGRIHTITFTVTNASATSSSGTAPSTTFKFRTTNSGSDIVTAANSGNTLTLDFGSAASYYSTGYIVSSAGARVWNVEVAYIPAEDIDVSVTSAKYATFSDYVARDFSGTGIKVYKAASDGAKVTLTEIADNIAPAYTGVVLFSNVVKTNEAISAATTASAGNFSDNVLLVSDGSIAGDGSTIYALGVGKAAPYVGQVGFYKVKSGETVPAGKAYLTVAAPVKEFLPFDFGEDDADGINSLTPALSEGEGEIYNLAGQRLQKMQKGINIVNGKKILF